MDLLKAVVREALLANGNLSALVGDRIYPKHVSLVDDPEYPCVTISRGAGSSSVNQFSSETFFQLDVWSKQDDDELWAIYNEVRKTINRQPLSTSELTVFSCREVSVNDELYETNTFTYHLASKYLIKLRG